MSSRDYNSRKQADYEADEMAMQKNRNRKEDVNEYTGTVKPVRLAVYDEPNQTTGYEIGELHRGDIVYIETIKGNKDWVSVFNVYGISGYCLRRQIEMGG